MILSRDDLPAVRIIGKIILSSEDLSAVCIIGKIMIPSCDDLSAVRIIGNIMILSCDDLSVVRIIGKIMILSCDDFITCAGTIQKFGVIFCGSQIIVSSNFGCISWLYMAPISSSQEAVRLALDHGLE